MADTLAASGREEAARIAMAAAAAAATWAAITAFAPGEVISGSRGGSVAATLGDAGFVEAAGVAVVTSTGLGGSVAWTEAEVGLSPIFGGPTSVEEANVLARIGFGASCTALPGLGSGARVAATGAGAGDGTAASGFGAVTGGRGGGDAAACTFATGLGVGGSCRAARGRGIELTTGAGGFGAG